MLGRMFTSLTYLDTIRLRLRSSARATNYRRVADNLRSLWPLGILGNSTNMTVMLEPLHSKNKSSTIFPTWRIDTAPAR